MSLKTENSRRVAESRPVCMDLYSVNVALVIFSSFLKLVVDWYKARVGCSEVVVVRYCSELQFSSSQ
jgi:hypothetical protein